MLEFLEEGGILYKKYLIISDLHIGYEYELLKKGINIPIQIENLKQKINEIIRNYNPKAIVINGDLKHSIPVSKFWEVFNLREFIKYLKENFDRVIIIKGNHDGKIEEIINDVEIYDKIKLGKFLVTHGHKKVEKDFKYVIIGHNHPVFPIKSKIGEVFYEKVFVVGENDRKVIILPAFSDIVGGWEVGNFNGPIAKDIKKYEVYTLKGELIYEGEVK